MAAKPQTYASHAQYVFMYHVVLFGLLVLTFGGACNNLRRAVNSHEGLYSASLIVVLTACVIVLMFLARVFALKAQDRAIRAEENLRHYVLTGKLLDPRITIQQVIALRFAPDDEFAALAGRAAGEGMEPKAIKQAIRNWKPDTYRV
jgi:hypothetical protein